MPRPAGKYPGRSLGWPRGLEAKSLKGKVEDDTIRIWYKKNVVVEVRFGWDTSAVYENAEYQGESTPYETAHAMYMADWKPEGAEEYKRQAKGRWDTFYPKSDEDLNELGEYLIRAMKGEFEF